MINYTRVILALGLALLLLGIRADKLAKENTDVNLFKDDMVIINYVIPSAYIELRYASADNLFGEKIYDDANAYLRRGTAQKLAVVQAQLDSYGYSIKIWDAYRPVKAQFQLWELCPDSNYVANPYKVYSNHSRGSAVDITLVDENGQDLPMPSKFDDFSPLADRDYSDVDKRQASNVRLLERIMESNGFKGLQTEWWHYDDVDQYEVVQNVRK